MLCSTIDNSINLPSFCEFSLKRHFETSFWGFTRKAPTEELYIPQNGLSQETCDFFLIEEINRKQ